MNDKNNEQIVFEMLEEVATESIADARNAYTYDEIDDCYAEAKKIAEVAKKELTTRIKKRVDSIINQIKNKEEKK